MRANEAMRGDVGLCCLEESSFTLASFSFSFSVLYSFSVSVSSSSSSSSSSSVSVSVSVSVSSSFASSTRLPVSNASFLSSILAAGSWDDVGWDEVAWAT